MANLKQRILSERGLVKVKEKKPRRQRASYGKFAPAPRPVVSGRKKTALMKYLEQKYGVVLEELLISGSLSTVAKALGDEVDVSTISRWIKRFKLRYTADNLPDCNGCQHYGPGCQGGVCYVLMDLELYELVMVKRKEMLGEGD